MTDYDRLLSGMKRFGTCWVSLGLSVGNLPLLPPEREEMPPPVITVEPHIYIDEGGGSKVMEITAPSGQKYKGSIKEDKD